jgi:hypothetical protein
MGNVAGKGSFGEKQAGFLWIVPPLSSIETKQLEDGAPSCRTRASPALSPTPAWFEVDDVSHELRWEPADKDDVFLQEYRTESASPGPHVAVSRGVNTESLALSPPLETVHLTDLRSISLLQNIKRTAHSFDAAPFLFRLHGESHGRSWSWTLQAPSAQELSAWISSLRRNITSVYKSITDDSTAVFQSIRAGDVVGL